MRGVSCEACGYTIRQHGDLFSSSQYTMTMHEIKKADGDLEEGEQPKLNESGEQFMIAWDGLRLLRLKYTVKVPVLRIEPYKLLLYNDLSFGILSKN